MEFEIVKIRVPKEDKIAIKRLAISRNVSMNHLLYSAIKSTIKNEKGTSDFANSIAQFTQLLNNVEGSLGKNLLKK